MKEIGSFIELELPKGREYYDGDCGVARLNTGRAAIWHAFRLTRAETIWIPYYQCETVREFLDRKGVTVKYYHQDRDFNPIDLKPTEKEAVLVVNYYGMMSQSRMASITKDYKHVIIDNCQAFFCKPLEGVYNVYSARKFMGVADGAYVIGEGAERYVDDYQQCYSSDTAAFLLKRIEYGCEGKGYEARIYNEDRVDKEDIMKMSALTRAMLDGADSDRIIKKRRENFDIACELFGDVNMLNPTLYYDEETVPMVYPLVVENEELLQRYLNAKHFQGHWWKYITKELPKETFEHWLSRYIIPITIDQRYGEEEIQYLRSIVG